MKKEKDTLNKLVCSTYDVFKYILFPIVLFGVFYISKLGYILNYTNASERTYKITLISLVIATALLSVIDRLVESSVNQQHSSDQYNSSDWLRYFVIFLITIILMVMFFMKKILLKNTFIVIFALNLVVIVLKLLWENIFTRMQEYCYSTEKEQCTAKCNNAYNRSCYEQCYEESDI